MADTLVVISCGSKKVWDKAPQVGPTPAKDAYVGPFFGLNREYAAKFSDKWVILSAKYGFLDPDFVIEGNYDVTFSRLGTGPISSDQLRRQVEEKGLDGFSQVVVLGGMEYGTRVTRAFEGATSRILTPLEGLGGIGYMMHAVREALDDGRPLA